MKPTKHAIAYVIYNTNRSGFLIVQRPDNDDSLPNMWGLPAGTMKDNESPEAALFRSGKEKLGIELGIDKIIGEKHSERDKYFLHLTLYEANIKSGVPSVPQNFPNVTQYHDLKWGTYEDIVPTARKGSLCTQILLDQQGINYM